MGELGEVVDQLAEIEQKEKELSTMKATLTAKGITTKLNELQSTIIGVQRETIKALLRISTERDRINAEFLGLLDAIKVSKEAIKEMELALKESQAKIIKDLKTQIEERDLVIANMNTDINLLKQRVKTLLGG